jgi:hypothetical protein
MFDRGEIGVDDLWLDSEIALEVAAVDPRAQLGLPKEAA